VIDYISKAFSLSELELDCFLKRPVIVGLAFAEAIRKLFSEVPSCPSVIPNSIQK
jgi:hypothetical protein